MIQKTQSFILFLYNHHFVRYLVVGGSTFALDFAILYILHAHLSVRVAAATSVAYWISVTYNFLLNRYWTFSASEKKSIQKNITAYFLLLIFNYFFVLIFVSAVSHYMNFLIAKAIAVILQMGWNYYLYKNYIFVDVKS